MTSRIVPPLTHERLKELLHYNPGTGVFTWLSHRSSRVRAGDVAGTVKPSGRRVIVIDKRDYFASRLAWFYVNATWPGVLHCIDGDLDNLAIRNLAPASCDALPAITEKRLAALLEYDQKTGRFTWRAGHGGVAAGTIAGCVGNHGYIQIGVLGRKILAHRLAWFCAYGDWPEEIDHVNGVRTDNRIANLRVVTRAENCRNSRRYRNNKTGACGVWENPKTGTFQAYVTRGGTRRYIGSYKTSEEAAAARKEAQSGMGFTDRHGEP